jgi:hypothetical protein
LKIALLNRSVSTKTIAVVVFAALFLSATAFVAFATKTAQADNFESSCSGSWSLQWVKQVDPSAGSVYVSSVIESNGEGEGHEGGGVYDGVGLITATTYPNAQVMLVGLGSGSSVYESSSFTVGSTYGTIQNNLYGSGGPMTTPDGSYTVWTSATGFTSSATGYLHTLCTGDQDDDDSPPIYSAMSLNGLQVTGTHNTVNLLPNTVYITPDDQYVVVGANNGYVAVWQWNSGYH